MSDRAIILYTTVLAFCTLYAPQPLLPRLALEFGVGADQAGLLITASLLPLGLAPVVYGYLLESVPARTLLRGAVLLLALSHLPLWLSGEFWVLVAARLAQGLLLPAIFTSLMTYLSTTATPEQVRKAISAYIAATILGGFSGRALAGLVADLAHWRLTFLLLLLGLLLAWWLLGRLTPDAKAHFARLEGNAVLAVLSRRRFRTAYGIIFLVFFVFASLLNLLPFRLTELSAAVSDSRIALVYSGYLIGVVIALGSTVIVARLGGERRAILLGLGAYLVAVLLFVLPSLPMIYLTMWLFCAGMFLIHSVLSAHLNHLAAERKGVVNGLYISCYYAGGTLGSFLPGLLYRHLGWSAYIACLALLVAAAVGLARGLSREDRAC